MKQDIRLTSKVEDVEMALCKDCRIALPIKEINWIATTIMPHNIISEIFPLCNNCLNERNRKAKQRERTMGWRTKNE
jgi:hypothetical protein